MGYLVQLATRSNAPELFIVDLLLHHLCNQVLPFEVLQSVIN